MLRAPFIGTKYLRKGLKSSSVLRAPSVSRPTLGRVLDTNIKMYEELISDVMLMMDAALT